MDGIDDIYNGNLLRQDENSKNSPVPKRVYSSSANLAPYDGLGEPRARHVQ